MPECLAVTSDAGASCVELEHPMRMGSGHRHLNLKYSMGAETDLRPSLQPSGTDHGAVPEVHLLAVASDVPQSPRFSRSPVRLKAIKFD